MAATASRMASCLDDFLISDIGENPFLSTPTASAMPRCGSRKTPAFRPISAGRQRRLGGHAATANERWQLCFENFCGKRGGAPALRDSGPAESRDANPTEWASLSTSARCALLGRAPERMDVTKAKGTKK